MSRKTMAALNRAVEILEREGRIHYAILAIRLGYSPEYFRRALLPAMLELSECIEREGQYVKWVCERKTPEAELTPEEKAILEARPVEG